MPKFFTQHKKPDPKKNFFQNYGEHLNYLEHQATKKMRGSPDNFNVFLDSIALESIAQELLDAKHLMVFDALRDGYDYTDELMGASVIPVMAMGTALFNAGMSIWEGSQALAIRAGFTKNDHIDHGDKAVDNLLLAGLYLAISVISLVKSLASLITRPIATAIHGWKPQDTNRFYSEVAENESLVDTVTDTVAKTFRRL